MKVTALIENKETKGLACEHGLAFYIEYRDRRYLLDALSQKYYYSRRNADLSLKPAFFKRDLE